MVSRERKISAVPPDGSHPSAVAARLASLEDEATRLRAEVAALQADIHWLTGDDEPESSWLARGWVRASLLLATVGVVSLASLPYLMHPDASSSDREPASAAARSATVARPPGAPPATTAPSTARLAPSRVRASEPAPGLAPRPDPAPPPAVVRARQPAAGPDTGAVLPAPIRGESP